MSGKAFCLARAGEAYALYLPEGGDVEVELEAAARYVCGWWDPAQGRTGRLRDAGRSGGGRQRFSAPGKGDWALRIVRAKD